MRKQHRITLGIEVIADWHDTEALCLRTGGAEKPHDEGDYINDYREVADDSPLMELPGYSWIREEKA